MITVPSDIKRQIGVRLNEKEVLILYRRALKINGDLEGHPEIKEATVNSLVRHAVTAYVESLTEEDLS